ncbi:hypothetical protein [Bradyrhizobium canariense]|uniref:hypothetical protein n=1 Tax=Bradyrhizobium canariense TaxID=255045 RepID=UPI001B8A55E6|nr:hypothetical protein [Bradyrhizobium canariense]MBR0953672.1 hypothetical protein [Bradyrhizobium canariense]
MIIECFRDGAVRLDEPLDFRKFKLMLHADPLPGTQSWKGISLLDDCNALVSIDLVPTLTGRPDDASWDKDYAEMVAKARVHGWIDAERNAIRAHIEQVP